MSSEEEPRHQGVEEQTPMPPQQQESAARETTADGGAGEDGDNPEEELVTNQWQQVEVHEVEVKTGEEDEEVFWVQRAKLYRWAREAKEWKDYGLGDAKLLKNKTTGKIRFLLRQQQTYKLMTNHYVYQRDNFCHLTPNAGSDKIWCWTSPDYAGEEPAVEQFGLRLKTVEDATTFKQKFEEACSINAPLFADLADSRKSGDQQSTGEAK